MLFKISLKLITQRCKETRIVGMVLIFILFINNCIAMIFLPVVPSESPPDSVQMKVKKTTDFELDGEGSASNWSVANWVSLPVQETTGVNYITQAKLLYSDLGIYFLFKCEDSKLTTSVQEDFGPLYQGDVVEVFLMPQTEIPVYFEYELSPLNYELPLLVLNIKGKFQGWAPNHYEGRKKVRHATSVQGGKKEINSPMKSWMGEIFIPFSLLHPLVDGTVAPGTKWKVNLYRIDHDSGYSSWSWQKTTAHLRGSLHEYKKFGALVFE